MLKKLITISFICFSLFVKANMAEPVDRSGSLGSRPFTNQFVDIEHEDLYMKIDKDFQTALYHITYHINAKKEGQQIPLLFYASDWINGFKVLVDGKEVAHQHVPERYFEDNDFTDFNYIFGDDEEDVLLETSPTSGFIINLKDMLYFETDITKGKHTIEVFYEGYRWRNGINWVNEYSFRYSLSPVKYWKSFGTLDITIDATAFNHDFTTNLGNPISKENKLFKWHFDKLPAQAMLIDYDPKISTFAELVVAMEAFGLASFIGLILLTLYIPVVVGYRKRHPDKKYSWVVILGAFTLPFLFMLTWIYSYEFIDYIIGEHAGKEHGYSTFFALFVYPLAIPVFWIIFWIIDKRVKNSLK